MQQLTICLPTPEVEALIQGREIIALPALFLRPRQIFLLYPTPSPAETKADYRPGFESHHPETTPDKVTLLGFAECQQCQIIEDSQELERLSQLTMWTKLGLEQQLATRSRLFFAYLRVYRLPEPREIPFNPEALDTLGKFLGIATKVDFNNRNYPVLDNTIFAQRQSRISQRLPPPHPQLEALQAQLTQIPANRGTQALRRDLEALIHGIPSPPETPQSELAWIQQIAPVGNSSDGHDFEKLVRRSLIFLGFSNNRQDSKVSLDPNATGGAGGIDFYCELPYPVVGECKASKHDAVPNRVTAQLIHLGVTHLGQDQFDRSLKIILAAGTLTPAAEQAAVQNKMNVLRPETLQRLTELKAAYGGAIDLLKLKPCLEETPHGEAADAKVNRYIDTIWQDLKLRSHLVHTVKTYLTRADTKVAKIDAIHASYCMSQPPRNLQPKEMHEILIELSSPFAGYLGREKGDNWERDRFYFLRDFPLEA
ncbi:MAG: DUF1802 family protein [Jaaginema sp. PMC 1079.18]|nr:DUF1802 family protein [Jaaginema sp. PMC 1080.18]MEC4850609.1 DUF1802 family protein [Jaaginema sp. PMC 1079.18]MEC4867715.1 DUF1802 family protein [Jaaginema sp. PMC 1078.18]